MDKLLQLALALKEVKGQVKQIQSTALDIQKQEGKQGIPGKQGERGVPGKDGRDGKDGKDGKNGKDGKDGKQGVGVVDAKVDIDNSLVVTLSDGTEIDAGQIEVGKAEGYHVSQQTFPQMPRIWVQNFAPVNPNIGDVWYDTSAGTMSLTGNITTKTADYSLTSYDFTVLCDATAGEVILTLPYAAYVNGHIYSIKKVDSTRNPVTITTILPDTVDGNQTTHIDLQWTSISIQSDGANWYII